MKTKPVILALAAASLGINSSLAQTTLGIGDVQVLGVTSDSADSFSFVLWKDISADTVIRFMDHSFTATQVRAHENDMALTFSSALSAGSVVRVVGATTLVNGGSFSGTQTGTLNNIDNGGDQVFVYQGAAVGNQANVTKDFNETLLYGFNIANNSWVTAGAATEKKSYLPAAINGIEANFSSENAEYKGTRTGLTTAAYRAAVSDIATNYNQDDIRFDLATGGFSINSSANLHWDANGNTAGDGGAGTWDTTTQSRFKNGASETTYLRWVNSTSGSDHTAVFGGTAGTVTVSGGVTASGLQFATTGYTLTGSTITLSGSTAPTIDTGAVAATIDSALAGNQGITKLGAGTLTVGAANSYTGDTTVRAGTLKLGASGTISGSSAIVVGDGESSGTMLDTTNKAGFTISDTQTLKGIGTVNVGVDKTLTIEGTHAVGNVGTDGGVGTQAVTGNLSYASGSIFEWDLNADSINSGFDKASATGTVAVSTTSTVFKVIFGTAALTGVQTPSNTFWNTTFATQEWSMATIFGKALQSGSQFANVETSHDVSAYGSFSINGSNLTWTAVPEPTSALAGLLIAAGLLRRRRMA